MSTNEATFNLSQHLQKQANMAYEGARGYFLAQQRAWMNCIKCQQEAKKSAQAAWQSCFDEFQKGDGKLSWIADHMGEAVASAVKKEAIVEYRDEVVKMASSGVPVGKAVHSVIAGHLGD